MATRNERIQNLEALLQEAKQRLLTQNEKFEAQLQAVRERLEQARSAKSQSGMAALNFGRIAKPLRGRGAVEDVVSTSSEMTTSPVRDKRSSWLPSFR